MRREKVLYRLLVVLLSFSFLVSHPVYSDEKLRVAVVEFATRGNIYLKDAGKIVAEWLLTDLGKSGVYSLQERLLLRKVLREQRLEISGAIDERTAVMIGKLYGVDAIITGSVIRAGGVISITGRIIDTQHGTILKTAEVEVESEEDLRSAVRLLAKKLIISHVHVKPFELKVTDGLKFFLKMDSRKGVEFDDEISGIACYGKDVRIGRSGGILFNCHSSYLECEDSPFFTSGRLSVAAWVKLRRYPGRSMRIISKDGSYALEIDRDGYPVFIVYGVDSVQGKEKLRRNRWYFIAATYDGKNMILYVNGVPVDRFKINGKIRKSDSSFVIGDWSEKTGDKSFCGVIDDVRVYNRILTRKEINDIYANGRSAIPIEKGE